MEDAFGLVTYEPTGKYKLTIVSFNPFREAFITPIIIAGVLLAIFAAMISLVVFWKRDGELGEYR